MKENAIVGETDEAQLLKYLFQGGPEAQTAFEMLFLQHYERVYRLLLNILGDAEQVADLAQEIFLMLYRQPPQPVKTANLGAWLRRVALNHAFNQLKKEKRDAQNFQKIIPDHSGSTGLDPEEILLQKESVSLVHLILAQLPKRQSQLLALKYTGFSYAEIASTLNIPTSSVGTLLVRAQRAFADLYNHYNQGQQKLTNQIDLR